MHVFNAYPYTPNYHYWSGDLDGLYYVDENRLLNLTLTGGAVPYAPKHLDLYMAGLMGNVEGYKIDFSRISSPVLYIGLGGGFSDYGSWWYKNEVGKINDKVTSIRWKNQGHDVQALVDLFFGAGLCVTCRILCKLYMIFRSHSLLFNSSYLGFLNSGYLGFLNSGYSGFLNLRSSFSLFLSSAQYHCCPDHALRGKKDRHSNGCKSRSHFPAESSTRRTD